MSNLALDMRPEKLEEVLGQASVKTALASLLKKDQIPTCLLFQGPPGVGKTTLAHIFAKQIQRTDEPGCDIRQINGADKRKIEDVRSLIEDADSRPFTGRYRVFIIDECHQLTSDSQNALLIPTERKNSPTVWIFCSTEPEKMLDALRSRCSSATFRLKPLEKEDIWHLINRAGDGKVDPTETAVFLMKHGVTAPREILGAVDQLLAGVPLTECLHEAKHEPLYKDVASAVLSGNWTKAAGLLGQIKTADSRGLTAVLSAFLRSALVKEPMGPKADALAACLVGIDSTGFADGTAYGAVVGLLYKTAKAISGANRQA